MERKTLCADCGESFTGAYLLADHGSVLLTCGTFSSDGLCDWCGSRIGAEHLGYCLSEWGDEGGFAWEAAWITPPSNDGLSPPAAELSRLEVMGRLSSVLEDVRRFEKEVEALMVCAETDANVLKSYAAVATDSAELLRQWMQLSEDPEASMEETMDATRELLRTEGQT